MTKSSLSLSIFVSLSYKGAKSPTECIGTRQGGVAPLFEVKLTIQLQDL